LIEERRVALFTAGHQDEIKQRLRQAGVEDRVKIADWDRDWGLHHLTEDYPSSSAHSRLVRALEGTEQRLATLQMRKIFAAFCHNSAMQKFAFCPLDPKPSFDEYLLERFFGLAREDQKFIHEELRKIAIWEGYAIPDWDQDWGRYHLRDDLPSSSWQSRLLRAILKLERKKGKEILAMGPGKKADDIVSFVLGHSKAVRDFTSGTSSLSNGQVAELAVRTAYYTRMESYKLSLLRKYPSFEQQFTDTDSPLFRGWKMMEFAILSAPLEFNIDRREEAMAFVKGVQHFEEVVRELIIGPYDDETAQLLLEVLLRQKSWGVRQVQLKGHFDLKEIEARGRELTRQTALGVGRESQWKDIFTIRCDARTMGKYKPNLPSIAAKEQACYQVDSILGFDMTAPTKRAQLSIKRELKEIQNLFKKNTKTDQREAMERFAKLPPWMKDQIYGCIYHLVTTERRDKLGEDLWWNKNERFVEDAKRILAIGQFLVGVLQWCGQTLRDALTEAQGIDFIDQL